MGNRRLEFESSVKRLAIGVWCAKSRGKPFSAQLGGRQDGGHSDSVFRHVAIVPDVIEILFGHASMPARHGTERLISTGSLPGLTAEWRHSGDPP